MTALTAERDTPRRDIDDPMTYLVKGNVKILSGSLFMIGADGYAIPAADTASCHLAGRAQQTVDTTATGPNGQLADGVATIDGVHGVFEYDTEGTTYAIVLASLGLLAYVLYDHTVVLAGGTSHTVAAGIILAVSGTKVWIDTRKRALTATT